MSSKLHLPNLDTAPPGGWRYTVPETGQHFTASSLSELMHHLSAHYKAAGYPQPPALARLVEDFICDEVPDACGGEPRASRADEVARAGWFAGLKHTFTNVLQGTTTLAAWIAGGRHYVSDDLANERALTCTACPENVEPQGCTGCNSRTLAEAVRAVIGNRTTHHDASLKSCKVCSCHLAAKVHLPHDVLWEHMSDAQKRLLPAKCWLIKERIDEVTTTSTTLTSEVTTINVPPLS